MHSFYCVKPIGVAGFVKYFKNFVHLKISTNKFVVLQITQLEFRGVFVIFKFAFAKICAWEVETGAIASPTC
jgi:hypothetical protein